MTKQKPTFDLVSKPGARIETWKPNAAMQEQLRADFSKAGFVFGADGKIDLAASAKTVKAIRR